MRSNIGDTNNEIMLAAVYAFKNTIKYGGGSNVFIYPLNIYILLLTKTTLYRPLNRFKDTEDIFLYRCYLWHQYCQKQ